MKASDSVKAVPADWVFKIKHRGGPIDVKDLTPKQFKARVVVRGQYMREGLNYNDTFAPVAKPTTLRALLAPNTGVCSSEGMSKPHFLLPLWIARCG